MSSPCDLSTTQRVVSSGLALGRATGRTRRGPEAKEEHERSSIASVMVFLSLVLRSRVNRWTNIVLPILYIVSIAVSAIGESSAYFIFLSLTEGVLLLLIIWYAWTWPNREGT